MFKIYTDGACSGNGTESAKGGWAYAIINEKDEMIDWGAGGETNTTNQRMELMACLQACRRAEELDPFANVKVYSDSAYLINCYRVGWWRAWRCNGWKNAKKQPVANQDLWEPLIGFFTRAPGYDFIKVKGHAGNAFNELVDTMAVKARESLQE